MGVKIFKVFIHFVSLHFNVCFNDDNSKRYAV